MSPKYTSESHKIWAIVHGPFNVRNNHRARIGKKVTANYVSNTFGALKQGQDHPVWLESVQRPRRYNHAKFNKAKITQSGLNRYKDPGVIIMQSLTRPRSPSLAWVGTKTPAL